jgi:CheY-like chemotaxis protein
VLNCQTLTRCGFGAFTCCCDRFPVWRNSSNESAVKGVKVPGASIFLVEDEGLIRLMLADMVEELGHRVVAEAGNLEVGQALAETAIFDLAILDINIAGRIISPVAEIIARRDLPFLFVSGYGPAGRPEQFSDRPVLQKPVLISNLGEAIDSMLSSAAGA